MKPEIPVFLLPFFKIEFNIKNSLEIFNLFFKKSATIYQDRCTLTSLCYLFFFSLFLPTNLIIGYKIITIIAEISQLYLLSGSEVL